jgi:hypothetical protein
VVAQVQSTIGLSDYEQRDQALKNLIQPLAGEYGMHNGEAQGAGAACKCVWVEAVAGLSSGSCIKTLGVIKG